MELKTNLAFPSSLDFGLTNFNSSNKMTPLKCKCIIESITSEDQARWIMDTVNKAYATPGYWRFIYIKGLESQDGFYALVELESQVPIGTKFGPDANQHEPKPNQT